MPKIALHSSQDFTMWTTTQTLQICSMDRMPICQFPVKIFLSNSNGSMFKKNASFTRMNWNCKLELECNSLMELNIISIVKNDVAADR